MLKHRGFAFVEVLQPCVTFNNTYQFYKERVYKLEETDYRPDNFNIALQKSLEWGEKIPIGIFYKNELPTYEDLVLRGLDLFYDRSVRDLKDIVNEFI
jgi:2-oxoglutarate ferredoxin oxidoreductase subunit beta